jgi:monovalent cation:H+ antiporter-2, CPA2 family
VERFPLFAGLSAEQREALVLHFQPKSAQPGERVIRAGDEADAAYFISSGQVEVSVSGRRIKLRAGDVFGEMALLSGQPRSADVTALDYSKFLTLSRVDFRGFVRKYPGLRSQVAALAAQRGQMNEQWFEADANDKVAG